MLLLTLAIIPGVIHGFASMVLVDVFVGSDSVLKLLSIFVFMAFTNISKFDSEYSLPVIANSLISSSKAPKFDSQ